MPFQNLFWNGIFSSPGYAASYRNLLYLLNLTSGDETPTIYMSDIAPRVSVQSWGLEGANHDRTVYEDKDRQHKMSQVYTRDPEALSAEILCKAHLINERLLCRKKLDCGGTA